MAGNDVPNIDPLPDAGLPAAGPLGGQALRSLRSLHSLRSEVEALRSLARLPDENPNPVLRLAADGSLLYANRPGRPLAAEWDTQSGRPVLDGLARGAAEALDGGEPRTVDVESHGRVISFHVVPVAEAGYVNLYGTDVTERRQAESQREAALQALARSEAEARRQREFLERLVATAPVGIAVVHGPDHRYELVNPAYQAIPGTPSTPMLGRPIAEVFPDVPAAVEMVDTVYRTGQTVSVREFEATVGPGRERTFWNVEAVPLPGDDGSVDGVLVLAQEVTEPVIARRRAQEMAAEAERRAAELDGVLEAIPDGVAIFGPDGEFRYAGGYVRALFGVTYEFEQAPLGERMRLRRFTFADGRRLAGPDTPLARALNGETVRNEIIGYHHDEAVTWISIGAAPLRSPNGDHVAGAVLSYSDVTELRAAQEQLEAANEELRARGEQLEAQNRELQRLLAELDAVFSVVPHSLAVFEADGRIRRTNPATGPIFRLSPDDLAQALDKRLRGRTYTDEEGQPLAAAETALGRALHGETVQDQIMCLRSAPGEPPAWLAISAAPLRGPGGEISGAVAATTDITVLRTAHEELRAANEELACRGEELRQQAEELQAQNIQLVQVSAELEAERARLQAILQQMPAGLSIAEVPSGKIVLRSERTHRIFGGRLPRAGALPGYRATRGYHPDGRPYRPKDWPLARALATGEIVQDEEMDIVRADGTRGTLVVSAAPIHGPDGRTTAAVCTYLDVTDRKAAEDELRRARDELESLLKLSSHITSNLALGPMLATFADRLRGLVDCTSLTVFRLEGDELIVIDYRGPAERAEALRLRTRLSDASRLKWVVTERRPLIVADLEDAQSRVGASPGRERAGVRRMLGPARSWLGVPLMARDRIMGVVRLTHDQPDRFMPRDGELALAFANHAAVAMENARLYEQAQELAAAEERQRLARDLHDLVSQTLFSASITADVLPKLYARDPAYGQKLLDDLRRMNRGALAELRALLVELRPGALLEADLGTLLTQLAEAAGARSETSVTVTREAVCPVPGDVQVALYRIAQEALYNVAKHARAREAIVCLNCTPGPDGEAAGVALSVADDGAGFDPKQVPGNSFGLSIMRERAGAIGAALEIEAAPGQGTRISVNWPGG